jgi:hypothetical protein
MGMKRAEVKATLTLSGNTYYIYPFGAFVSVNMSGEVFSFFAPVVAGAAPIVAGAEAGGDVSLLDVDAESAARHLANAVSGINGDRLEKLMKKLLVEHQNISVEAPDKKAEWLTKDLADELFCCETQDMFILAMEVIKVNYDGFFKNLAGQFGGLRDVITKRMAALQSTEN